MSGDGRPEGEEEQRFVTEPLPRWAEGRRGRPEGDEWFGVVMGAVLILGAIVFVIALVRDFVL